MNWFEVKNVEELDSPSLLIYKEKVESNISKMIDITADNDRLMPHIKTNKMENVVKMMIEKGLYQFKCATVAEAELAAKAGAKKALIAHQMVGPKIDRLIRLTEKYPEVQFASLVDDWATVQLTNSKFEKVGKKALIYIDINSGMDRSGHALGQSLADLIAEIGYLDHVQLYGFHVYDGHIRADDFTERKTAIESGFAAVKAFIEKYKLDNEEFHVIAGGTPAFTSHASEIERICSPGTCVLWDWGYGDKFAEQPFEYAAVVLSRVISKPAQGIIATDMGHKAVSSENPIHTRIRFLNLENYELLSQSEEHGVIRVDNWDDIKVGDVLYGVPFHVCPTVNLYDEAYVISENESKEIWNVEGRKRRISL